MNKPTIEKKRTSLLVILIFCLLAVSPSQAKIGESPLELMARYGEPINPLTMMMGIGEWNTQQGTVIALIKNGSAQLIAYRGSLSEEITKELLARNLPNGQKWSEGKGPKNWLLSKNVEVLPGHKFFETADGSVWAIKSAESDALTIGTPEAFELLFNLQARFNKD